MKTEVTTVEPADILKHAEKMGHEWNDACDIIEDIYPGQEYHSIDVEVENGKVYLLDREVEVDNEECNKIVSSFCKKHNLEKFEFVV